VRSVVLAKGAPVRSVVLPGTLTTLRLEYLAKLTTEGLQVERYDGIQTLVVDSCPGVSWQSLYEACGNLKRVRISGMALRGSTAELQDMLERGVGGVDASGSEQSRPVVAGTYYLTEMIDEAVAEELQEGIEGLYFELTLEACIAVIAEMNGEGYDGVEEVEAPTLETIGDEFVGYNGEDYDAYIDRYTNDNKDINELIEQQ
jgi:hypothetical protein